MCRDIALGSPCFQFTKDSRHNIRQELLCPRRPPSNVDRPTRPSTDRALPKTPSRSPVELLDGYSPQGPSGNNIAKSCRTARRIFRYYSPQDHSLLGGVGRGSQRHVIDVLIYMVKIETLFEDTFTCLFSIVVFFLCNSFSFNIYTHFRSLHFHLIIIISGTARGILAAEAPLRFLIPDPPSANFFALG